MSVPIFLESMCWRISRRCAIRQARVTGAVSIFQDISELKRAQQDRESLLQELERSNRELSQFSYAVSHDLQAPVRSVRALTQILVRRDGGSRGGYVPPVDTD